MKKMHRIKSEKKVSRGARIAAASLTFVSLPSPSVFSPPCIISYYGYYQDQNDQEAKGSKDDLQW